MPRVNLTITDDNYQFLKQMKDSGKAASLSHAVRLTIHEYRKLYDKPRTRDGVWHRMMDAKGTSQPCRLCAALEEEIEKTRATGETERESLLKFLLKGHQKACHQV